MNLSKKERDGMRQALSFLDGFTFTEDEDEFMAGSGLGGICLDLGRCLDDLDAKDKEIEVLEQNLAAAEETIVHKDNEIEALKAKIAELDDVAESNYEASRQEWAEDQEPSDD